MTAPRPSNGYIEFEDFRFDPEALVLSRNDKLVEVVPKALELLRVLIEAEGRPVTKQELIERVWPNSFVEEANLSYNIYKLRRALGEEDGRKFIETLPKRGYRFAVELKVADDRRSSTDPESTIHAPAPSIKRSRFIAAGAAAFFLIAILSVVLFIVVRSRTAAETAVKPDRPRRPISVSQVTTLGTYSGAAISPDGQYLTYVRTVDLSTSGLYLRRIGAPDDTELMAPGNRTFGAMQFSRDNRSVYFLVTSTVAGKWDLYRVPVAGGPPMLQITIEDNIFTLSPDGERALYFRFDSQEKKTDIVSAKIDGSGSTTVFSRPFTEMMFDGVPSISPDGEKIAFGAVAGGSIDPNEQHHLFLYTLEIKSGEVKQLSSESWRGVGMISWLHDSSGLIYAAARKPDGNQLYYMSLPRGEVRQITKEFGTFGNFGASISDDGLTIVGDRSDIQSRLWRVDASKKGNDPAQLTNGECDGNWGVAAGPDGSLVYSSRSGDDFDLWRMTEKDGRREGRPLTSDPYFDGEPAVAPDGSTIAFVSDRAGSKHLFSIKPDGTGLTQITSGTSFDENPGFSPDGKWIYYSSRNDDVWHVRRVSSMGGDPQQITEIETLAPSVSPDGSMIACVIPREGPQQNSELVVLAASDGRKLYDFPVLSWDYHYSQPKWTTDSNSLIFSKSNSADLWRQDLKGGQPVQVTDLKTLQSSYFTYSGDHRSLIVSRIDYRTDVVLIKNFEPAAL